MGLSDDAFVLKLRWPLYFLVVLLYVPLSLGLTYAKVLGVSAIPNVLAEALLSSFTTANGDAVVKIFNPT